MTSFLRFLLYKWLVTVGYYGNILNCLCQWNKIQIVPNNILGKVTNFGVPTIYRQRVTTKNVSGGLIQSPLPPLQSG